MATEMDVSRIRRAAGLSLDDETYTDSVLGLMIDQLGFEAAVSAVWREKASSYAGLVDTTESGSSRRLSQLHAQALAMGTAWDPDVSKGGTSGSYTVPVMRV